MVVDGCTAVPIGKRDVGPPRAFVEAALIMIMCVVLLQEVMWYVSQWISPI